jgi:hypothetical protein
MLACCERWRRDESLDRLCTRAGWSIRVIRSCFCKDSIGGYLPDDPEAKPPVENPASAARSTYFQLKWTP